jgi:hypothetical protein
VRGDPCCGNRRVLDDWTVVYRDAANLLITAPDSTDGLAINSTVTGGGGKS